MEILSISPIKHKKAYLQIVDKVVELIAQGKLEYGSKLYNEQELVSLLGVSRPTLREALRVLEFLGIVTTGPRKGILINKPADSSGYIPLAYILTFEQIKQRELFELRQALQIESAGLAALRRTPAHLRELKDYVLWIEASLQADTETFAQLDYDYHQQIIVCAENQLALKLMNTLGTMMRQQLENYIREMPIERRTGTLYYHRTIAEHIERGEVDQARDMMCKHLTRPYDARMELPIQFRLDGDWWRA